MIKISSDSHGGSRRRSARYLQPLELDTGIKLCAGAASAALLLNLIFAIVALSIGYSRPGQTSFLFIALQEGDCSASRKWSTWLHLLINILGTAIVATSNYCAQFLCAPRREDIDRAHLRDSWMDIGIPSLRNIWALGKKKKSIWAILFLTTIPVHAIYNSVILMSKSSNEYNIFIAPADYDGTGILSLSDNSTSCFQSEMHESLSTFDSNLRRSKFDILTKQQCADTFSTGYLPGHGSLVILSRNLTWEDNDTLLSAGVGNAVYNYGPLDTAAPYGWMCPDDFYSCTKARVQNQMNEWTVAGAQWSKTAWSLKVPSINGTTTDFVKNSLRRCPSDDPEAPICIDLKNLFKFVWSGAPMTATDIDDYLNNSDNWLNATWASQVEFYAAEIYCDKVGETSSILDKHYTVDGCLSVRVEEHCQLLFSPLFSLIVLICTTAKVACIFVIAYREREPRLLTVGDAIASFLTEPDRVTKGRCLASKTDWKGKLNPWNGNSQHMLPRKFELRRKRWWHVPSILQWAVTLLSCTGYIICAGLLLNQGLVDHKLVNYSGTSLSELWSLGLGNLNASTIIFRIDTTLLGNVLVANIPQIVISVSYYYYNTVLTSMVMASEYDNYAVPGPSDTIAPTKLSFTPIKALRVSGNLQGSQRSTYFLSLPYRYSVPLIVSYAVLHWLVSQSIFYVKVIMYDAAGNRVPNADVDACGWSPMALILSIALGGLIVLTLIALGLRRFKSCIALAGSCSAAISAACHRPRDDSNAALEAVMWGEVSLEESSLDRMNSGKKDTVVEVHRMDSDSDYQRGCFSHCCFTSYKVVQPSPGQVYV